MGFIQPTGYVESVHLQRLPKLTDDVAIDQWRHQQCAVPVHTTRDKTLLQLVNVMHSGLVHTLLHHWWPDDIVQIRWKFDEWKDVTKVDPPDSERAHRQRARFQQCVPCEVVR